MLTGKALFHRIANEIAAFFGQEHYKSFGPAIAARKPAFRQVFLCAALAAATTAGACLLILAAYLFYPQFRRPMRGGCVFQFGLSANNERSFRRLNENMGWNEGNDVEMNRARIPLGARMRRLSFGRLWRAAQALHGGRSENPFIITQQALGCAARMLFDACLADVRPLLVVVANDHSPTCVALRHCARDRGLPVLYIQHAPVNRHFPPLTFDLSILYDEVSREDYRASALSHGLPDVMETVILSPFRRSFRMPAVRSLPLRIGICLGLLTARDAIAELVGTLDALPHVSEIHIREHPRSRGNGRSFKVGGKVALRPRGESLEQYLMEVDVILVPNSGVCIECLHHGKPAFYLPHADKYATDNYGFLSAGILPIFDIAKLADADALNAPFDGAWRTRFSRFDATESNSVEEMEGEVRRAVGRLLQQAQAA